MEDENFLGFHLEPNPDHDPGFTHEERVIQLLSQLVSGGNFTGSTSSTGTDGPVTLVTGQTINVKVLNGLGSQTNPTVAVSNLPIVQAVSANSLPLPIGAATESTLSALNFKIPNLGVTSKVNALPVVLATDHASIGVTVGNFPNNQNVLLTNWAAQPPVQIASGQFVAVSNLPLEQDVFVKNFPAIQPTVLAPGQTVNIGNFPFSQTVSVNNFPATQTVAGTITVGNQISGFAKDSTFVKDVDGGILTHILNLPAVQAVSGTVNVGNFPPAVTSVSINNLPATQNVSVNNFPVSQAVTGTFFPTSQAVTGTFFQATQNVSGTVVVSNFPSTQLITGSVDVGNFPATQAVTGPLTNIQLRATPVNVLGDFYPATQAVSLAINNPDVTDRASRVLGHVLIDNTSLAVTVTNIPSTQTVTGTVSVGNFPTIQNVNISGWDNATTLNIGNFPVSQAVTGNFFQTIQPVSGAVNIGNFPATQAVSGNFFQATQPVSGAVNIGNFPTLQTVAVASFPTGQTVNVGNFPSEPLTVTGTFFQATQPVSLATNTPDVTDRAARLLGHVTVDNTSLNVNGTISVGNFPASQAVTGAFFQSVQPVSGSVNVGNFPAVQTVSVNNLPAIQNVAITSLASGQTIAVNNFPASQAVTGAFFQASQPVSLAINNPDVTDRASRVLGHVVVDNPTLAVTGAFFQATQPVSGTIAVTNFPANQTVSGAVSITNFPATQNVAVTSFPTGQTVNVGNFPASQTVNGSVNIGNLPATQTVNGSVSVSNFPVTQGVSGTTNVGNFPASQAVTGDFYPVTQAVSGSISVSNLPTTQAVSGTFFQAVQPVSGSVNVSNFPASQAVTGAFFQTTQPVSGSVSVGNFPATQVISATSLPLPTGAAQDGTDITTPTAMPAGGSGSRGWLSAIWTKLNGTLSTSRTWSLSNTTDSVNIGNFPATQPVSGSVNVGNFPLLSTAPASDTGQTAIAVRIISQLGAGTGGGTASSVTISDGTTATQKMSIDASGRVSVVVSNFPVIQSVGIATTANTVTVGNTSLAVTGTFFQATQPVSGSVNVGNFPAIQSVGIATTANTVTVGNSSLPVTGTFFQATQPVSGSVNVGNFPATQAVSGAVSVSNFPAIQSVGITSSANTVTVGNTSLAVTGTFYPTTQPVSGVVTVDNIPLLSTAPASDTGQTAIAVRIISQLGAGTGVGTTASSVTISDGVMSAQKMSIDATGRVSVVVTNFPAIQSVGIATTANTVTVGNTSLPVTGTFFQATQPVSGSVNVGNFPAIQSVGIATTANTVTVGNASLAVTGTFFQTTQPVSGSVSVGNFPATQAVSGAFFPTTQPVSGSVTVDNLPLLSTAPASDTGQTAIGVRIISQLGASSVTISDGTTATQKMSIDASGRVSVVVSNFPATQAVSGSVGILAGTAAIGSVSVSNFPASQAVTGTFFQTTQPVSAVALTDGTLKAQMQVLSTTGVATAVGLAAGNIALPVQLGTTAQLAAGITAAATPHGSLRVTADPTNVFYDAFAGSVLDTVDRWNTTGTAPTQSSGTLTFPAAALATTSILSSKPLMTITSSQFLFPAIVAKLETAVGTGVGRFFGLGTPPTTPSTTSLAQEGVGFELDATSGALQAVTYTSGAKTVIAALTKPTDGLNHRYAMQYRNSRNFWFIDDINVFVATAGFLNNTLQDLNVLVSTVSGAAPLNSPSLVLTGIGVGDLARQATQIGDGTFGWRKASVGRHGGLSIKGAAIPAVSVAIAAAGTGTLGPVDVSEAGNATFIVKNTVAASPYGAGMVLVFEQSDDNVSWAPLLVVRASDGASVSTHTAAANTANASLMFDTAMEGVSFARVRVTSGPATNGATLVFQGGSLAFSPSVSAVPQPITKGTQGIAGVTTQDLKDAGRAIVTYYSLIPVLSTATDTLQSLTGTKGNATVAATVTPAVVTAGKTMRIQRMWATYIATATSGFGVVRLRYNVAGVAAITSPILLTLAVGSASPVAVNATGSQDASVPDGLEVAAGTGIGVSVQGFAAATATAVGYIMVGISGYEY